MKRTLAVLATTTLLSGLLVGTASAEPRECRSWDLVGAATFTGSVPRTTVAAPVGGGSIKLEGGRRNRDGASVVWAHHFGGRAGHKSVWMDVSFNRGASWIQCGPFETWGDSVDSRIHVTSPDPAWKMRACGWYEGGSSVCSRWY
ncbi:hypothetical protein N8J89_23275 [Crossiella sp. CA-258035]|uniref:hypothetical protein n=1 Tax=Crossiella sp. CA-258035 TaxID=2981138 RepID=UPI0024BC008F|nr:hypothetical protein [Crossiella sp. CA-258035]WHT16053.1 hypothetical protein N8J89_23275 [Crossiella sp. CA-258035]